MRWVAHAFASLAIGSSLLFSAGVAAQNIRQPDRYGCGPTAAANCVGGAEKAREKFYNGVCRNLAPGAGVVSTPRPGWGGVGGVSRWELCDALNAYDEKREWKVDSDMPIDEVAKRCEGDGKVIVLFPATPTTPGHFMTICEAKPTDTKPTQVVVTDPATGHNGLKELTEPIIVIYPEKKPKR